MVQGMSRSTERGSGLVIALAVTAAAIVFLLFLNQSRLTSWTSAETDVLVRGDAAEMLADSANQEALAWLRPMLADPGSEAGARFRDPDPARWTFDVGPVRVPHTLALMTEDEFVGFDLQGPRVTVTLQSTLDGNPYERKGAVVVRASVATPQRLGRPAVRRVETAVPFTVVLPGVPRPACSFGLFLGDAEGVTDRVEVNGVRAGLVEALEAMGRLLAEGRAAAPDAGGWDDLASELSEPDAPTRAPALPTEADAAFYGLEYEGLSVDLTTLDLAADLAPLRDAAVARQAAAQAALGRLRAAPSDPGAREEFVEALKSLDGPIREGLWDIWAYRRAFRVLPSTDPAYAALAGTVGRLHPSHWERRARFVVRPLPGETDVQAAWERFLVQHPRPQGVILVDNGAAPLVLTGALPGQAAVVTGAGGVTLRDLNVADAPSDLLTVVARGGPVIVEGQVHAALVLANGGADGPSSLHVAEGATLTGALVAWRLPSDTSLRGTLVRAEKHSSGITTAGGRLYLDPSHLVVGLLPAPAYRKVVRR